MALEIFRLVGSVFVDTLKAEESLRKTGKSADELAASLSNGVQNVGRFVAGVGATVAAAGAGMVALAESTREYRTEQGKLQAGFEASGFSAAEAEKTYKALNGVLGDSGQAVEAANHLAKLAKNEKDLSTWTNIATGVFATFGDSLPIEGLTEAANETAKVGAVTGPLADALNWAGVSEDAFNEKLAACTSEQERQKLITETLNGLYDEAADKYREVNGEVIAANEAQDRLNSVMADIGGAIEPILTKGKELVADVLEKGAPIIENLAQVAVPFLAAAFETLVNWLGQAVQFFQSAYTWMQENETAVTLIGIALGTLTAAIIAFQIAQNAAAIATAITTAATTAWGAAVAFLTSPVTLVIAAIGALIAIVYLLVKNWDTVKAAAGKAWDYIKQTWSNVAEWFSTKVTQPVGKFFSGLWDSIKRTFSNVTDWFSNTFRKAWQAVKNVFSAGGKIFDGIKSGISSVFTTTVNAIIRGINKVVSVPFNALNKVLGRLRDTEILNIRPFSWVSTFSVPQIPELEDGGVLKRGQVGLLEGNGAEAVVPLDRNKKWISAVAQEMEGAVGSRSDDMTVAILSDILELLAELADMRLYLDSDAVVGGLAKKMDRELGRLQVKKARA